jgi:hypothetical protein
MAMDHPKFWRVPLRGWFLSGQSRNNEFTLVARQSQNPGSLRFASFAARMTTPSLTLPAQINHRHADAVTLASTNTLHTSLTLQALSRLRRMLLPPVHQP